MRWGNKGRLAKEVGLYLDPERRTKSQEEGRKARCMLVTLNFQQSGYIFQGLYKKVREKLVKIGWGQISENLECQFREWGLFSVSDVESLKASEKGRVHVILP